MTETKEPPTSTLASLSLTPPARLTATCHCLSISLTFPTPTEPLNQCMCSICGRYSGLWAYYNPKEVLIAIEGKAEANLALVAGFGDGESDGEGEKLQEEHGKSDKKGKEVKLEGEEEVAMNTAKESVTTSRDFENAIHSYAWGDKDLEFHRCKHCGCVMHWMPKKSFRKEYFRMGINCRMLEKEVLDELIEGKGSVGLKKSPGPSREGGETPQRGRC